MLFKYFIKRLMILIPTLIGVTMVVFAIINMAPGGPIEQKIQQMRFGGGGEGEAQVQHMLVALSRGFLKKF